MHDFGNGLSAESYSYVFTSYYAGPATLEVPLSH
jgi:hypothetical protein